MVHILPPATQVATPADELMPQPAIVAAAAPLDGPTSAEPATPQVDFVDAVAPAPTAMATSPLLLWSVGGAALFVAASVALTVWLGNPPPAGDTPKLEPTALAQGADTQPDRSETHEAQRVVQQPAAVAAPEAVEPPADHEPASHSSELPELPALPASEVSVSEQAAASVPTPTERAETPRPIPPPATATHSAVLNLDPLDFDPERLSLSRTAAPAIPAAASIDAEASEADLPIDGPVDDADDDAALPEVVSPTIHVRLGPMPAEGVRSQKLDEQLQITVQSLDVTQIPLQQFVSMISDIAGVPITLDPHALALAGVSPRQTVSVRATEATLATLLHDALAKLRLDCVEDQGQLRIVLRGGERWRAVDYPSDDLVDATDATELANLITRFVAPTTWQPMGGKGTIAIQGDQLRVEQTVAVQHEILIFLERLRLARGLNTRSRYPAARLLIDPSYERLAPKLQERATFTFLPWVRFSDLVRYWEEASGLTILVDWAALADVELESASPVACSATDRTWLATLDGILEPLNLDWWQVDGETIQITTLEAAEDLCRIEFYAVPAAFGDQFASDEALLEALISKARAAGSRAAEQLQLEVDDSSASLIVRASPKIHRLYAQLFKK
jgi:hypothetical protein